MSRGLQSETKRGRGGGGQAGGGREGAQSGKEEK